MCANVVPPTIAGGLASTHPQAQRSPLDPCASGHDLSYSSITARLLKICQFHAPMPESPFPLCALHPRLQVSL